jgi:hypothetical protein
MRFKYLSVPIPENKITDFVTFATEFLKNLFTGSVFSKLWVRTKNIMYKTADIGSLKKGICLQNQTQHD